MSTLVSEFDRQQLSAKGSATNLLPGRLQLLLFLVIRATIWGALMEMKTEVMKLG